MIFAAISYPVLATAIVGAFMLVAAATAAALTGQSAENTTFVLMALAFAAVMGVWQARGRERRAAQLADEHGRSQRYLDVAGTMIVVMDADGMILQVNRRSCEVLGYREEELLGRDWFELAVPEDVRADARADFTAALAGMPARRRTSNESPVVTRAGERRSIAWSGRIVPTRDGVGMLVAGEDVTEQRAAQERVQHMAYHDALTGLANRAKLEEHLTLALARARRHGRSAAVLYIDLDHFKVVNDTLGHAAGDELLRQVAARLAARCRATDLLARHGGDEFMLLLADIDGDARATADRSRRTCCARSRRRSRSRATSSRSPRASASRRSPRTAPRWPTCSSAPTARSTRPRATAAARSASPPPSGPPRDRPAHAHRAAAPRARARRVRAALPARLRRRERRGGRGRGAAALERPRARDGPARRVHPRRRGQRPDRADRRLGRRRGDRPGRRVARAGPAPRHRLQPLPAPAALPRLRRPPARPLRAPPTRRQFIAEITESAAMADPERTGPLLERLAAAGLRLAIDDFGADFSSLARLRDLPVHELKIDRSFLRGVPGDGRAAAIVTAIVPLAQALELTAVAEGVEDAAQLDFLAAHGCALAQGFHLARPLPAARSPPLLQPSLARK